MRIGVAITPAGIFIGKVQINSEPIANSGLSFSRLLLSNPAKLDLMPMGMPGRVPEALQIATLRNVSLLGIDSLVFFREHLVAFTEYELLEPSDGTFKSPPPPLITLYLQSLANEQKAVAEPKQRFRVS
mgnify:CR=1 FL=1